MITGLNIQTTGLDIRTARIVEFGAAVATDEGKIVGVRRSIVDSGEPIPADAERVHHITSHTAANEGIATSEALDHLNRMLLWSVSLNHPIAMFNAPYGLSIIRQEAKRADAGELLTLLDEIKVIDPLIIDKEVDKFRSGPRTLDDLINLYGFPWEGEEVNDPGEFEESIAVSQAMKAAALAVGLMRHPRIEQHSPHELHDQQVEWAKEQKSGLARAYKKKRQYGKAEEVDYGWPYRR